MRIFEMMLGGLLLVSCVIGFLGMGVCIIALALDMDELCGIVGRVCAICLGVAIISGTLLGITQL